MNDTQKMIRRLESERQRALMNREKRQEWYPLITLAVVTLAVSAYLLVHVAAF
jgi:hypothetical protein